MDIVQQYEELMDLYSDVKRFIHQKNRLEYERWKAGGFLIDDDIMSMYPSLGQVMNKLCPPDEDDNEDEYDNKE